MFQTLFPMNDKNGSIERITLRDVIPTVFAGLPSSEIWGRTVQFERGKNYLLRAESGSGKSSLSSFIYCARRKPEYNGTILFDDRDISKFSKSETTSFRRRNIAYLPQDMLLFGDLTALENIRLKNSLTGYKSPEQIREMMDRLGIGDCADRKTRFLSVGQQQRVAIVRALCQPFDFLLLDEPVSHLDNRNNDLAAELIADETAATGAAVIATSVGADINFKNPFKLISL